jgi:23S rRNA pseudoU1915 N3-methylase RlmH
LENTKRCLELIESYKSNQTKKTVLSSLYIVTGIKDYSDAMLKYCKEVNAEYKERRTKNTRLEAKLTVDKIGEIFKKYNGIKNPNTEEMIDYIIICVTSGLFMAPRRSKDWFEMKIKNYDKKTDNYCTKTHFVFNKFKTAKFVKEEDRKIEIPKELQKILAKWIKNNTGDYLIYNYRSNKPFSSSSLNKRLNKIYGDHISVDYLRSLYLTTKYGDVMKKMEDIQADTKAMGTSVASAMQYYIKEDI